MAAAGAGVCAVATGSGTRCPGARGRSPESPPAGLGLHRLVNQDVGNAPGGGGRLRSTGKGGRRRLGQTARRPPSVQQPGGRGWSARRVARSERFGEAVDVEHGDGELGMADSTGAVDAGDGEWKVTRRPRSPFDANVRPRSVIASRAGPAVLRKECGPVASAPATLPIGVRTPPAVASFELVLPHLDPDLLRFTPNRRATGGSAGAKRNGKRRGMSGEQGITTGQASRCLPGPIVEDLRQPRLP